MSTGHRNCEINEPRCDHLGKYSNQEEGHNVQMLPVEILMHFLLLGVHAIIMAFCT